MRAVPLSAGMGVELPDFDITRAATAEEQAELRQLLCDHHFIVVRSTTMTDDDHDRFVKYFGPLSMMGETHSIIMANDAPDQPTPYSAALGWHFDLAFTACPNIATALWGQDVAPGATPTGLLNAVRALKTLPPELRTRIEGLSARNVGKFPTVDGAVPVRGEGVDLEADAVNCPNHVHPIVYRLPHSDQQCLFVAPQMTSQILGMPLDESDALLDELLAHLDKPENIYYHEWCSGDVLIWDNIALQHSRPEEIGTVKRQIRRLSIDGWNNGDDVMTWYDPPVLAAAMHEKISAEFAKT